jgi:branched-chain amino acid transport system permease protein
VQILINGLITGLTIAVMALAFTVVYLPTHIFYIALAGIYAAAPFLTWMSLQWGWAWYWSVILSLGVGVLLSLVCEWLNHAPLDRQRASSGAHLVSSLGLYIMMVQAIAVIWGNETKVLRMGIDTTYSFGGAIITQAQAIAAIVSVMVLGGFYVWLQFSQLGLQFRALADNPQEFMLKGYNARSLRLIAFGLSGFLGSLSGILVAYDIGFDPQGGLSALLLAVVATIIGGRQSFWGAACGGVLLGLLRSQVVWFLSARWQEAVTFLLLAIFLFLRPQGILGQKGRLEAES